MAVPLDLREIGMAPWDAVSKAQAVQTSKRKYVILEFAF